MNQIPAILAAMIAAAGWYYLFYSQAAVRLGAIEDPRLNHRRRMLRRVNGVAMFLLAICFFAGFYSVDADARPQAFVMIWLAVFLLLLLILVLAVMDIRLTARLRDRS